MNKDDRNLLQPAQADEEIEGFVAATDVEADGEYVAVRQEGQTKLYCTAWRENGRWRRLSDWSEQIPESLCPQAEVVFAPQTSSGAQHA